MTPSRAMLLAVARAEWLAQRREPLSVLYVLVLGALAAAFAAAGPVELVAGRGSVPRDSSWSVTLASTAITAVGQVITTMIAATTVLRDRADRVLPFLLVSSLSVRGYLAAKLATVLLVLLLVYVAIPAGLLLGALLGGGAVAPSVVPALCSFVALVLPTMLAIGALQFAAAVLSQRLWVVLGLGLSLIWLWSAVTAAAQAGTAQSLAVLALDPFGSAPVVHGTRDWTDAQRATLAVPITPAWSLGRALWLALGAIAALCAIRYGAPGGQQPAERARRTAQEAGPVSRAITRGAAIGNATAALATARLTLRWMLRDTGWRVLTALGAINVVVHVVADVRAAAAHEATAVTLRALQLHGRLFLILLATIYAGELVWRERDDRSAALWDALPIGTTASVAGRVLGTLAAQTAVVLALAFSAAAAAVSLGAAVSPAAIGGTVLLTVLAPFVLWMLVSLGVQALVQQKAVAHLLCIAGWVVASALVQGGTLPAEGDRVSEVGWMAAALMLVVARLAWRRGVSPRGSRSLP